VGEDEQLDVTFEIADDGGQTYIRTVDKDARAAITAKAIQDELLQAIDGGQGLGINVLAKQLGKRKATLQDVLQQMLGDGLITSQRGPNASVLYYPRGMF
jgi:DNA-binding MarR family transcriptional regulator